MNASEILICTVGGSHPPIVRAIRELKADFVCFIASEADLSTGKPGSDVQIEGKGNIIKANPSDDKPSLPNIPTQCDLQPGCYELRRVPADDLDRVYQVCRQALEQLRRRFPEGNITADYTGGTKTMTAGLVLAAIDDERVVVQLITGGRVDLIRVRDGYESAAPANTDVIRLERHMQPYLGAWARFAYSEAEAGLRDLTTPKSAELRGRLNRTRDLSAAFAAWDRFDHLSALHLLQGYAAKLPPSVSPLLGIVSSLNDDNPQKRQAAQLLDLYLNALRRDRQGRYDDTIARLYRLLEWTAQWVLEVRCNVKTADLPEDFAPHIEPGREGKRQAGLFEVWRLVESKTDGALAQFFRSHQQALLNHLRNRNESILAHGFTPVHKKASEEFLAWIEEAFIPALLAETSLLAHFHAYPVAYPAILSTYAP